MNPLRHILKTLIVIVAESETSGWRCARYGLILYKDRVRIQSRRSNLTPQQIGTEKIKSPVVVVMRGAGIVSKTVAADSELLSAVSNGKDFVWATERVSGTAGDESVKPEAAAGGESIRLTFMRRELWDSLMVQLGESRKFVIATHIGLEANIQEEIRTAGEDFFGKELTLANLIKPGAESNTLASLVASRLLLPVLACALMVLTINYRVNAGLQETVEQQSLELGLLRKNEAAHQKKMAEKKKIETLYLQKSHYPHSVVADRIASLVPTGIMLTMLTINPIEKRIQNYKPLQVAMNKATIKGESVAPEPVTQFTESLKTLDFVRRTRLLSYDRNRSGKYSFEIEIEF